MQFEWDDAKSDACFIYRGFDFTYALRAFFDDGRVVTRDRRWDYGEDRYGSAKNCGAIADLRR